MHPCYLLLITPGSQRDRILESAEQPETDQLAARRLQVGDRPVHAGSVLYTCQGQSRYSTMVERSCRRMPTEVDEEGAYLVPAAGISSELAPDDDLLLVSLALYSSQ
jgi:hypothetical protein